MSAARIEAWFEALPLEWAPVARELRDLLLESSPHVKEQWKYNTAFYGASLWLAYFSLQKGQLVLGFTMGAQMTDPERLFAPSDHKLVRHYLPPPDVRKLPLPALRRLVQEAIAVNGEVAAQRAIRRRKRS